MAKVKVGPDFPFGEYMPDQAEFGGASLLIQNVVPDTQGYRPFPEVTIYSSALNARCQGAVSVLDTMGTSYTFAGTVSKLYSASGASWTDATRAAGGAYAAPSDGQWRWGQFGNNLLAVNGTDANQTFALGSSTQFSALAGSPPIAEDVAVVRNFVVLLSGNSLYNSAINDSTGWTVGTNQANSYTLTGEGSRGVRVIGGEYGLIFCRGCIFRMDYVGTPLVFQITRIEENRGIICKNGVAKVGSLVYFISDNGFYVCDGLRTTNIGEGKVNRRFLDDLNPSNYHRVYAVADPQRDIVIWGWPTLNSNGNIDRLLIYHRPTNRFSEVDLTTSQQLDSFAPMRLEVLWKALAQGYTLEGLDAVSTSIDALPFGLDSDHWAGGAASLGAFIGSHRACFFTSSYNFAATLDTAEAQPFAGRRTYVSSIRPIINGATSILSGVTGNVGHRETQMSDASVAMFTDAAAPSDDGSISIGTSGRYIRARMNIAYNVSWKHALGFDAEMYPDGER